MSAQPFMQVYVADYTADTQHLSCEEDGAYWRLLRAMWRSKGSLKNDPKFLARICGLTPSRWARIGPTVMELFVIEGGCITQKRLAEEFEKASVKSTRRAEAGSLGGKATALKLKGIDPANAEQSPGHSLEPEPEVEDSPPIGGSSEVIPFTLPVLPARDVIAEAFVSYNELAESVGIPKALKLTAPRRAALKKRLEEHGEDGWARALQAVSQSDFLRGIETRWKADLDFLLQPSKLQNVLEGKYQGSNHGTAAHRPDRVQQRIATVIQPMAAGAQAALDRRRGRWSGL